MSGAEYNRHRSEQTVVTPPDLMRAIRERFGYIRCDLAANESNAQAPLFFTEEDDALTQEWPRHDVCWCNPPFAKFRQFTAKAVEQSDRGSRIVMLATASVSTDWWRDNVQGRAMVVPIKRVRFVGHTADFPKDMVLLCYGFGVTGWCDQWDWRPKKVKE